MISNFWWRSRPRLTVLMYHKVAADDKKDFLTVPSLQLEAQFEHLQQQGYTPVLLSDLVAFVQQRKPLPPNPLLLTFDDGYRDNYTVLYPLLEKYNMKAAIFLVPSFLEQENHLSINDIRAMDPQRVEFGLHSFDHVSYKTLNPEELANDIERTKTALHEKGISFQPCLAFPYGAYPKRKPGKLKQFFRVLKEQDIAIAFRIGNRVNPLPLRNPLLVQRIDVRGDDPPEKFRRRMVSSE